MFADLNHQGYFGHMVTGTLLNFLPFFAQLDGESIEGRLMFSLCGGAGAAMMLIGDRPTSWGDAVARITSGICACFLFGSYAVSRFNIKPEPNSVLAVFGVIGALSWYVAGSVGHGLRALRDSGSIWKMLLAFIRVSIPAEKSEKAEKAEKTDKPSEKPNDPVKPGGGAP